MDETLKTSIWQQFGAAIDMLENVVHACPDELWCAGLWDDPSEIPEYGQFWYIVFHTLIWLDLFLYGSVEGFTPPDPFTRDKRDPETLLPDEPYTKDQLRKYLDHGREKCQATIDALTDAAAQRQCRFEWMELSFAELLLCNMRHIQDHTANLNMFLGHKGIAVNDWVPRVGR